MAIQSITIIRRRIGDDRKIESESIPVDGSTTTVQLKYSNVEVTEVFDLTYKADEALTENTDYTYSPVNGTVTLLYTPEADSKIDVTYGYYAFTDEELNDLEVAYGLNGACVEAVRWLIADSARLHDYSRGATSESLSQIIKNLQSMLKDYTTMADKADTGASNMQILKRTNQWYRGTRDIPTDLSRDDSLSL